MDGISLVVSAVGTQIYTPGIILTRIDFFFGSVAFCMFLRVFCLYTYLVATLKLKHHETYFLSELRVVM